MTDANPTCERCNTKMVWIGIGPGAEALCPTGCLPVLPGQRCPFCKSFNIESFEAFQGFMFKVPTGQDDTSQCKDCTRVFRKKDAL